MRLVLTAFLVVTVLGSPAVAQVDFTPGRLPFTPQFVEPVRFSVQRDDARTRNGFVFVEVTIENTSNAFVSVNANKLVGRDGAPPMRTVVGKQLGAWIEDEANRERASVNHRRWGFTSLSVAGALVGLGGAIGHSSTARVIGATAVVAGAAGGIASEIAAANVQPMVPDGHLLAGEITLAPHATVKRWFLVQLSSAQVASNALLMTLDATVALDTTTLERSYLLAF